MSSIPTSVDYKDLSPVGSTGQFPSLLLWLSCPPAHKAWRYYTIATEVGEKVVWRNLLLLC